MSEVISTKVAPEATFCKKNTPLFLAKRRTAMLPERIWLDEISAIQMDVPTCWTVWDTPLNPDDIPYIREPEPCQWTKVPDQPGVYTRGCSKGVHYDPDLYCGHCGARIVIEESKE